MQAWYEARFTRDMGCTEAEWLRWLPGAVGRHPVQVNGPRAEVDLNPGLLKLHWQVQPPRQIALMRMPRLAVSFRFDAVDDAARQTFMRFFDLYTQRGGG